MGRFLLVVLLGSGIVAGIAWYFNLNPGEPKRERPMPGPETTPPTELGNLLFPNAPPAIPEPVPSGPGKKQAAIPPIPAHLQVMDKVDIGPLVEGQILLIGEPVPDDVVALGGVAPFSAYPFRQARVTQGSKDLIVIYRRLQEGRQDLEPDQIVAMLDPAKALHEVAITKAKLEAAKFDYEAAFKVFKEAETRYDIKLKAPRGTYSAEEIREAKLGAEKFELEAEAKKKGITVAENELRQALTTLKQHYIRNTDKHSKIKTIYRNPGDPVKNLETIMHVLSTDYMTADGLVDVQYLSRLTLDMPVIVEPTKEEPFSYVPWRGHKGEINCVAVSKDAKPYFVSGSEDKTAYVWKEGQELPVRVLRHTDAVKAVACSPRGCPRNWCVTGCGDGSIYLWDLDSKDKEPVAFKEGGTEPINCLAFSPDGAYIAVGGDTGLKMWKTEGLEQLDYQLDHTTEGAITALSFTPQGKLVTASRDKMLRVWELYEKGAKLVGQPIIGRSGNVGQLDVSRNGRWMLFDQGKTLQLLSVNDLGRTVGILQNSSASTPFETLALFSPDASLILTAGAPEGRLQLWRCPTNQTRGYEVRQFVPDEKSQVTCAAFANDTYAISGNKNGAVYLWRIPTNDEVQKHRITDAKLTMIAPTVEAGTRQLRIGVKLRNDDHRRLVDGLPVTIVIEP